MVMNKTGQGQHIFWHHSMQGYRYYWNDLYQCGSIDKLHNCKLNSKHTCFDSETAFMYSPSTGGGSFIS